MTTSSSSHVIWPYAARDAFQLVFGKLDLAGLAAFDQAVWRRRLLLAGRCLPSRVDVPFSHDNLLIVIGRFVTNQSPFPLVGRIMDSGQFRTRDFALVNTLIS
jgi:hypothetical protein